jgi:hypothetical protein
MSATLCRGVKDLGCTYIPYFLLKSPFGGLLEICTVLQHVQQNALFQASSSITRTVRCPALSANRIDEMWSTVSQHQMVKKRSRGLLPRDQSCIDRLINTSYKGATSQPHRLVVSWTCTTWECEQSNAQFLRVPACASHLLDIHSACRQEAVGTSKLLFEPSLSE